MRSVPFLERPGASCLRAALALLTFVSACSHNRVLSARLYDLSAAEVLPASFTFSGTTRGEVTLVMQVGDTLRGEYRTIREGTASWGLIFSQGGSASTSALARGLTYRGSAVAISRSRRSMECEYVTSSSTRHPEGFGVCRDNDGRVYRLMF